MRMSVAPGMLEHVHSDFDIPSRAGSRVKSAYDHAERGLDGLRSWADTRDAMWCASAPATNVEGQQVLRLFRRPEVTTLAASLELATGDAIHNLRVALDAFAIEIGYQHGTPVKEDDIQFPCEKGDRDIAGRDARLRKKIRTMLGDNPPQALVGRIGDLQSWSQPPLWFPNVLETLVMLDNADKHRFGLEVKIRPQLDRIVDPDRMTPMPPRHYDMLSPDLTWVDLLDLPQLPLVPMWFPLKGLEVVLATEAGWGPLEPILLALCDDVRRSLYFLTTGEWIDPCILPGHVIGDDLLPYKEALADPRRTQAMQKMTSSTSIRTRLSRGTLDLWTS